MRKRVAVKRRTAGRPPESARLAVEAAAILARFGLWSRWNDDGSVSFVPTAEDVARLRAIEETRKMTARSS